MIQASRTGKIVQKDDNSLVIPIKIREQVAGVLRLRKPQNAPGWSRAEIDLMQSLSDQLSVALESARLYEETRKRAERERLTGEITARVRSSDDPQIILQTAVRELRRALQASRAQVLLYTTDGENLTDEQLPADENYPEKRPQQEAEENG